MIEGMPGLRAMGYCRVSSMEQARDGVSLDAQEGRIRAWAEGTGADLVDVVIDAGVSGTKRLEDREQGARIAALLNSRSPGADTVVVLRLDRLGRDAAESLALLKRFRAGKVGLVSLAEHLDLATPAGRAMAGMTAVFAELERGLIGARTTEALAGLKKSGKAWNHPPFGWHVEDGRLVEDSDEQDTLERIRDLRASGLSYERVAAALERERRPTKRGGRWYPASVRAVLGTNHRMVSHRPGME
jgi:site-specific DNA recombinase